MMFRFNDFALDPERFELSRKGETLPAEPKVLSVLLYLVEQKDRLVTKDELINKIWDGRAISDWTLTGCIKSARQLLGDNGKQKKYIKTVHGRGFRFIGEVHSGVAAQDEKISAALVKSAPVGDHPVVAILPFDNMSIDPEQEYLADGISEDIITILSKIPELGVIARNSTFKYKNQPVDIREVGRELGATHILEGSIRCIANRVRITAQLIETINGTHVWADQYDREMSDVFALQDDITREVVSALHIELIAGERAQYWARGTHNFEAWKLQLQATQLIATQEKESGKRGRILARKAAELDPDYSEPWATLGISYFIELMSGWDDPPDIVLGQALDVLTTAMERDADNPLALVVMGSVKVGMRDYEEGLALCKRAYGLGDNSFDVVGMYLIAATFAGNIVEVSQVAADLTRHLDALEPWHLNALGMYNYVKGDLQKTIDVALESVRRDPNHLPTYVILAFTYVDLEQLDEARNAVAMVLKLNTHYSVQYARLTLPFKDPNLNSKVMNNLISAGLSEITTT